MSNIFLEYVSDRELYLSYMPFLKNGGIFIRTTDEYEIGTELVLDITLPDALESSQIKGRVCWLTPPGVQNGTPAGIGVTFDSDPNKIKHQIEKTIARLLNSSEPTLTM
jgi:type IV pilus assembly protein PilZ